MFEEKSLLYCTPFYFKDGNAPSPKYFLVLKEIGNGIIVANLPSSQVYVPFPDENVKHGCIDLPQLSFSCFCIQKGKVITDLGYSFRLNTFIYGRWVEEYSTESLGLTYRVRNEDYSYCGKVNEDTFTAIIHCLRNSTSIKRRLRLMLE